MSPTRSGLAPWAMRAHARPMRVPCVRRRRTVHIGQRRHYMLRSAHAQQYSSWRQAHTHDSPMREDFEPQKLARS
jgi:hypothetical protein